jgi:hypothetical protein
MEKVFYERKNKECEDAIIELDGGVESVAYWLRKYKALSEEITYGPPGRPKIAMSNYEGVRYESISKFHSVYTSLQEL